jgi:DNA (cytosine-5)-methyltransferase 1
VKCRVAKAQSGRQKNLVRLKAKDSRQISFGEFFAGIGLMRLGLETAGWAPVFANDIDDDKWEMYRDQFGNKGEFVLGDIHKLDSLQIPRMDLATASFPCNDLSLAGARRGLAGTQSSAFWGFIDVLTNLGSKRPPLVLLENVAGFLTSNDGRDFEDALMALNRLGYTVDAFIIDAERFVPQSRQRLFVVGQRGNSQQRFCDTPRFFESECRPPALADFIMWHGDINWNIRALPALPRRTLTLDNIIEDLSPNSKAWWSRDRAAYLLNQMSPRHRAIADAMIRGPEVKFGTVFRRVRNGQSMAELRVDGIAGCLRTPRGGSGRQILFKAGKNEYSVRLLTSRECARLMGADNYRITVPLNQALFGFGDAVCVPVIKWIADHYLTPVFQENYAEEFPVKAPKFPVSYR